MLYRLLELIQRCCRKGFDEPLIMLFRTFATSLRGDAAERAIYALRMSAIESPRDVKPTSAASNW